jgi:hypothetical protein
MKKEYILLLLLFISIARAQTPANYKVAFIGDQGAGSNAIKVLELIKNENAHMVLHQGDFDYRDDPDRWEQNINSVLGENFPYFASVGNHDLTRWIDYQKKIKDRINRLNVDCTGDIGVKSSCLYNGLFFILSGVGTTGSGHETYIRDELSKDKSIWKICTWHKTMRDMQVGGKGDSTGWEVYQACQEYGAFVATGHEHSYSRTYTLRDVGDSANEHGRTGQPDKIELGPAKMFVVVSGLGGASIRDFHAEHASDTWWATIYTSNYYLKNGKEISNYIPDYGALFITFNVDNNPNKANAYFKNIQNEVIDVFEITNSNAVKECNNMCLPNICSSYSDCVTVGGYCQSGNCCSGSCTSGDLNNDGKVDLRDLIIIARNFGKTSGFDPKSDPNRDGGVDLLDLILVARAFSK